MKAVVQRVTEACVTVDGVEKGRIGQGLLVYLGVALDDGHADADWLAEKIISLRIFDDGEGRMNLSIADAASLRGQPHSVLAVSQFTLMGDARKGRRPSWSKAAPPEKARELYGYFLEQIRGRGLVCENGEFQADMRVSSINNGPVTILLDSKEVLSFGGGVVPKGRGL